MQSLASRPKRTLGALAVVLAAVGITVGSGANFTASQANAGNLFTTGKLSIGRDKTNAILSMTNMKPGDSQNGTIVVQNTGTIPGTFHLAQTFDSTDPANSVPADVAALSNDFDLKIVHCTTTSGTCTPSNDGPASDGVMYNGKMSGFNGSGVDLDGNATIKWGAGEQNRYSFTVTFPNGTPANDNPLMNKSMAATYTWSAQQ